MAGLRRVLPTLAAIIAIIYVSTVQGGVLVHARKDGNNFKGDRVEDDVELGHDGGGTSNTRRLNPDNNRAGFNDGVNNPAAPNLKLLPPQAAAAGPAATKSVKIADSNECREDVKTNCKGSSATNNFAVLECLQNDIEDNTVISKTCQHFVWTYKKNLTNDIRFDSAAHDVCAMDLSKLNDCNTLERGRGLVIPCLIEVRENITQANCKQFLTKMEMLIFSDYRLVSSFTEGCTEDIQKLQCGRLPDDEDGDKSYAGSPHTQGKTVECLSESVGQLTSTCKTQILRIAELQADDYHLDRQLYYACRLDRERFCEHTKAGSGKVYKCLFKHKFEADMSSECRSMIVVRQKLTQEDVKVNKGLFDACRVDIRKHHCLRNTKLPEGRTYRLSTVLLCLEGVQREGVEKIDPKCAGELNDARRGLLEDYEINPEVVSGCANEIAERCDGLEAGGKTMHCLMALAANEFKEIRISDSCKHALEFVLSESGVADNVMLDPFLVESCQEVIDTACKFHKADTMMSCLMEKVGGEQMLDECEDRLMEIQYFMARDFKLSDSRLFKYCKSDARHLCNAASNWYEPDTQTPERGPTVFMCLYRHLNPDKESIERALSRPCAFEVLRVMRQRSISVDLEPRIEIPCLEDLGTFCSDNIDKGAEMQCLQDHYDELHDDCQDAVEKFTEDEGRYIDLDRILMKACTPMIKQFCGSLIEDDESPPEAVMECLIEHKTEPGMNRKCAAGIEHHQLTSLKDYRFSYSFKEACKDDVLKVCKNDKIRKKSDVIKCLSESVRNATLLEELQKVSSGCRKQLNFELLQRAENIKLDPELDDVCAQNIQMYCANVSPGHAGVIECLKQHADKLDKPCQLKIFTREELEAMDSRIDFALVSTCKEMIKTYCHDAGPGEMFPCLRRHKDEQDFSLKCRRMVVERLRIRSTDIRLNPTLQKACKMDIDKFCKSEIQQFKDEAGIYESKVLMCLRKQFVNEKARLTDRCAEHMEVRIADSMRDYQQDPLLTRNCKKEIMDLCMDALAANRADPDGGHVDECLLKNLHERKIVQPKCITEIARIAMESKADVHVDPLLYRACALNIKTYCGDVPRGQGRQMSCLLSIRENSKFHLEPECKKMLDDRVQLWEFAAKQSPVETVGELASQIAGSPARSYLMLVLCAMVGTLFILGLFCGRVTKRVAVQTKNK